jgi:hypothetical protein
VTFLKHVKPVDKPVSFLSGYPPKKPEKSSTIRNNLARINLIRYISVSYCGEHGFLGLCQEAELALPVLCISQV